MKNNKSNTDERVLLLGAGGMLGAAVYEAAAKKYPNLLATDIDVKIKCWDHFLGFPFEVFRVN